MVDTAKVRDKRRERFFTIDNEIVDDFGERIGHHGIAVYVALARYTTGDSEQTEVGITKLAQRLKMGRAKLLSTVELLKDVGLIAVEYGDRTTTNTYTLLDVPKGGSNENQSGSNENQGGGSNENRKKTTNEKTTSKKQKSEEKEVDPVVILNPKVRRVVDTLLQIKDWDKNQNLTAQAVELAITTFPNVDVETVAKNLSFKIATNAVSYKKPSKAFSNWVSMQNDRNANGNGGSRYGQGQPEQVSVRNNKKYREL